MRLWPFGRRRRSADRESIDVELQREKLEDRRLRRTLLRHGVQNGDDRAIRAALVLGGSRTAVAAPQESFLEAIAKRQLEKAIAEPKDPITQLVEYRKAILELRRIEEDLDDRGGGTDGDGNGDLTRALIGIAPALLAVLTGRPVELPAQQAAPIAVQPPPPAPSLPSAPSPPVADDDEDDENVRYLSPLHVGALLHNLRTMDPPAFAAWIVRQGDDARAIVESWAATPDDELAAVLAAAIDEPAYEQARPVLLYLRDNPERARAIVAALRVELGIPSGGGQPAADGPQFWKTGGL